MISASGSNVAVWYMAADCLVVQFSILLLLAPLIDGRCLSIWEYYLFTVKFIVTCDGVVIRLRLVFSL